METLKVSGTTYRSCFALAPICCGDGNKMAGGIRHSYGLGLGLHPNPANIGRLKANKYSHVYKDFDIQVVEYKVNES